MQFKILFNCTAQVFDLIPILGTICVNLDSEYPLSKEGHIVSRYCAVAGTELSNDGPKQFFMLVTLTNSHLTKGYNP